jgi:hypothetical protein
MIMRRVRTNPEYLFQIKLYFLGVSCFIFLPLASTSQLKISKVDTDNCIKCHKYICPHWRSLFRI